MRKFTTELTKKQQAVVDFIESYVEANGYAPSLRNIGDNFGFTPKAAYDHLRALKKKGVIKVADNLPRGIVVLKKTHQEKAVIEVPLVGTTAAGMPILSEEVIDGYVPVPSSLLNADPNDTLFALKVRGDSMIGDGINDGDIAIMKKTKEAINGEIVAASIGDNEEYSITLKHFFIRPGNHYELKPSNPAYQSLISDHCDVHGKLLMIIRNY